jgi:hypothetical protein
MSTELDKQRDTLKDCIKAVDVVKEVLLAHHRSVTEPLAEQRARGVEGEKLQEPRHDAGDKFAIALASCATLRTQIRDAFAAAGIRPT